MAIQTTAGEVSLCHEKKNKTPCLPSSGGFIIIPWF